MTVYQVIGESLHQYSFTFLLVSLDDTYRKSIMIVLCDFSSNGTLQSAPVLGALLGTATTLIALVFLLIIRIKRTNHYHAGMGRSLASFDEHKIVSTANNHHTSNNTILVSSSTTSKSLLGGNNTGGHDCQPNHDADPDSNPDIIPNKYDPSEGECGGTRHWAGSLCHQYSNPVAGMANTPPAGTFPRDARPKDLRLSTLVGNGSAITTTLQRSTTQPSDVVDLNPIAIKERLMANRLPESCV